jgi:hypothetical protein
MRRTSLARPCLAACCAGVLAGCASELAEPSDPPAEFVAVRRAWLPGERDATIARIMGEGGFGPYSSLAPLIYADPDSVTVIARNPAYSPSVASGASGLVLGTRWDAGWDITGLDVRLVDNQQSPPDTTDWVGVFWSNPAEASWKGFVIAASATTTVSQTTVATTAFDASGGKSGAGGGEFRSLDGTYWQGDHTAAAPNNTITISFASYGAAQTVTSGPFLGGTAASGLMFGRLRTIRMDRLQGSTSPPQINVDYDFTTTSIPSVQLTCIFPSPCTTNAVTALRAMLASYGGVRVRGSATAR